MTLKCSLSCRKSFKVLKSSFSQISKNLSCSSAEFMTKYTLISFAGLRITGRAITGWPTRSKRQSDSSSNQYLTIETSEALFEHQKNNQSISPLVIKLASQELIGPNYKLVVRDESDQVVVNQSGNQLPNCLFRGVIEGREDAQVAISTCGQTLVSLSLSIV